MNVIARALEESGLTQSELAARISVTPQAVNQWVKAGHVPAERCRSIEEATRGRVTRYDLRPDVFGPAPKRRVGCHVAR